MRRRLPFAILSLASVGLALATALQPARWPTRILDAWLLRQTPVGTEKSRVRTFLADHSWLDESRYRGTGGVFWDPPGGPQRVVGVSSLRAHVGEYRSPVFLFVFQSSTEAFYAFDAADRLIDVFVRKTTDAP